MEYLELKKIIESGKVDPVYFFFGEDPFNIDKLVSQIVNKIIDPNTSDFNCDFFRGEEVDGETVVGLASSFPMVADRRLVVVKSIQKFSTTDKKRILDYVKSPLESTVLILTAGMIDRRQSFYSSLIKNTQWIECKRLYENEAVEWIKHVLLQDHIHISQEGCEFLVFHVGTDRWSLYNEIEKLKTYAWGKKKIELEHVRQIAGTSRTFNIWDLTDAVGRRDMKKALMLLTRLINSGQSPIALIMDLGRRLIVFMKIRSLLDRRENQSTIIQSLGLRPYFAKQYIQQVQRFGFHELEKAMRRLRWADLAIKTGYLDPETAVTLAVYGLVSQSQNEPFIDFT